MNHYKEIFNRVELSLRKQSHFSDDEFIKKIGKYKHFPYQNFTDDEYYQLIVKIAFYSGFKAGTTTKKLETILRHFSDYNIVAKYDDHSISSILNDSKMIKNEKKIKACIKNAKQFKKIIEDYGSFKKYIDSFNPKNSFENLILFKEDLEIQFDYLGGVTTFHFLTDIGLPVLKPDRVITRIFYRLGLIKSDKHIFMTVIEGRKFSEATGYPIRYIDIIFVKYGQVGKEENFGAIEGICLEKNPLCHLCSINEFCRYSKLK